MTTGLMKPNLKFIVQIVVMEFRKEELCHCVEALSWFGAKFAVLGILLKLIRKL